MEYTQIAGSGTVPTYLENVLKNLAVTMHVIDLRYLL